MGIYRPVIHSLLEWLKQGAIFVEQSSISHPGGEVLQVVGSIEIYLSHDSPIYVTEKDGNLEKMRLAIPRQSMQRCTSIIRG